MNRLEITKWKKSLSGWRNIGVGSKSNRYVARENDSKWGFFGHGTIDAGDKISDVGGGD